MTDGRFSGGSVGLVIGHVGPEAAIGGPIALIKDGDKIEVNLNINQINCMCVMVYIHILTLDIVEILWLK